MNWSAILNVRCGKDQAGDLESMVMNTLMEFERHEGRSGFVYVCVKESDVNDWLSIERVLRTAGDQAPWLSRSNFASALAFSRVI